MRENLSLEPGKCIKATKKGGKSLVEMKLVDNGLMSYMMDVRWYDKKGSKKKPEISWILLKDLENYIGLLERSGFDTFTIETIEK